MRPGLVWGIPPGYRDGFEIVDIGLCSTGVSLGGHRILMKLCCWALCRGTVRVVLHSLGSPTSSQGRGESCHTDSLGLLPSSKSAGAEGEPNHTLNSISSYSG